MTYNNKGVQGCSARGIARRETIKELQELAERLKDSICNVEIKPCEETERKPDTSQNQSAKN
jgi:hypothetical protein